VLDHAQIEGVSGLYSMVGGKLASYRIFAQEASDLVARSVGNQEACRTHLLPLPGGEPAPTSAELAEAFSVPEPVARRVAARHGSLAERVLDDAYLRVVCPCEPVLECEVRYVLREEGARTLDDVCRRTRLGLGP